MKKILWPLCPAGFVRVVSAAAFAGLALLSIQGQAFAQAAVPTQAVNGNSDCCFARGGISAVSIACNIPGASGKRVHLTNVAFTAAATPPNFPGGTTEVEFAVFGAGAFASGVNLLTVGAGSLQGASLSLTFPVPITSGLGSGASFSMGIVPNSGMIGAITACGVRY